MSLWLRVIPGPSTVGVESRYVADMDWEGRTGWEKERKQFSTGVSITEASDATHRTVGTSGSKLQVVLVRHGSEDRRGDDQ